MILNNLQPRARNGEGDRDEPSLTRESDASARHQEHEKDEACLAQLVSAAQEDFIPDQEVLENSEITTTNSHIQRGSIHQHPDTMAWFGEATDSGGNRDLDGGFWESWQSNILTDGKPFDDMSGDAFVDQLSKELGIDGLDLRKLLA